MHKCAVQRRRPYYSARSKKTIALIEKKTKLHCAQTKTIPPRKNIHCLRVDVIAAATNHHQATLTDVLQQHRVVSAALFASDQAAVVAGHVVAVSGIVVAGAVHYSLGETRPTRLILLASTKEWMTRYTCFTTKPFYGISKQQQKGGLLSLSPQDGGGGSADGMFYLHPYCT